MPAPPATAGDAGSPPPLPPSLAAELETRADGAALAEVWRRLEVGDRPAPADAVLRADAWARLAAATGVPAAVRRPGVPVAPGAPAAPGATPRRPDERPAVARPAPRPAHRMPGPAWAARPRGRARLGRLAAAALVLAVGSVGLRAAATVRVSAAPGRRELVTLPDGSRVELNAGSTLQYARLFSGWRVNGARVRQVSLDGEAFFSVTRGGGTFVVRTPDAAVTVLGTRFDVRARGGPRWWWRKGGCGWRRPERRRGRPWC
jgi:hypothetical protein